MLEQPAWGITHTSRAMRIRRPNVRHGMERHFWLSDGRLVLWRPDAVGGSAGLYVLDPEGTGQGSEIEVIGTAVGYLTG